MVKKLLGFAFAGMLAFSTFAQDVHIRIGPPAPVVERRGPPPGRNYVWVDGYHRYDRDHYVWTPGRWEVPPEGHHRWERHRWVKRHGEWVMVEGHWR